MNWDNTPILIRKSVEEYLEETKWILQDNFIGGYLHGSMAMGCFCLGRSDVDLLVITKHSIDVDIKKEIALCTMKHSSSQVPIEISFLHEEQLHPWRYPCPFDFHFSEMWREELHNDLCNDVWRNWNSKTRTDPDLAAHITMVLHRGVCLYGLPIHDVFPQIPDRDYVSSIMVDFMDCYQDLQQGTPKKPVYSALNMCRVYGYLLHKKIYSKEEAGRWVVDVLPDGYREVVNEALEIYIGRKQMDEFEVRQLIEYSTFLYKKVMGYATHN